MRIARIGFAPVKGGRHVEHPAVELAATGPVGDRRFCLVDPATGRVLRTVQHPTLLQAVVRVEAEILSVTLGGTTFAAVPEPTGTQLTVDYWGRTAAVEVVSGPWAAAFSDHLGRKVVLAQARPGQVVYGASVTLVTTSSARMLADRLGAPVDSTRFRATLVVDTGERPAHVEDTWIGRELEVGAARIRVRGPVPRCGVIDLDPATGHRDAPVLAALAAYRREPTGISYGVDAVVTRPGIARTGDPAAAAR